PPTRPTPLPYTTLFRSGSDVGDRTRDRPPLPASPRIVHHDPPAVETTADGRGMLVWAPPTAPLRPSTASHQNAVPGPIMHATQYRLGGPTTSIHRQPVQPNDFTPNRPGSGRPTPTGWTIQSALSVNHLSDGPPASGRPAGRPRRGHR